MEISKQSKSPFLLYALCVYIFFYRRFIQEKERAERHIHSSCLSTNAFLSRNATVVTGPTLLAPGRINSDWPLRGNEERYGISFCPARVETDPTLAAFVLEKSSEKHIIRLLWGFLPLRRRSNAAVCVFSCIFPGNSFSFAWPLSLRPFLSSEPTSLRLEDSSSWIFRCHPDCLRRVPETRLLFVPILSEKRRSYLLTWNFFPQLKFKRIYRIYIKHQKLPINLWTYCSLLCRAFYLFRCIKHRCTFLITKIYIANSILLDINDLLSHCTDLIISSHFKH